ncbi:hypothetical protein NHX12_005125, partial [Muraenolepis orangiensis]
MSVMLCRWEQNNFSMKLIYTDWANHYLAKSGHKRLIKDLQTDVTDGVLLAEIIQVVGVAGEIYGAGYEWPYGLVDTPECGLFPHVRRLTLSLRGVTRNNTSAPATMRAEYRQ